MKKYSNGKSIYLILILIFTVCFNQSAVSAAEKRVTLSMVGDVLLHTPVVKASDDGKGGYDFKPIFKNLKNVIESYDIAIVNQETIPGGKELGISGYPAFNAPYEIGDAIADGGFDIVLHANNHALDRGKKGVVNTLKYWKSKHPLLAVLGMYGNKKDSEKIYVAEKNGIKIAILNYTYGTNGIKPPADMPFAVNYLEKARVEADIKKARRMADFVVVCPHWGTEYNMGISDYQRYWTDIFLKNKVDLVIGAHPHVIEPIEWVKDKKTGHRMLVYYSLGNFVNATAMTGAIGNRYIGGMAEVTIIKEGEDRARVGEYGITALLAHREDKRNGFAVYKLSEYTEKLMSKHQARTVHKGFNLKYCIDICNKVWGGLWK